jgi:hypothetical protein
MGHGAAEADPPGVPADPIIVNVAISESGVQPSAVFVPAGRPVQLMLRSRGLAEHHYRVVGLTPDELMWAGRAGPSAAVPGGSDHDHHSRQFQLTRAPSPAGIRPTGREVHAYVTGQGSVDVVRFTARQAGRFAVRCDLHDEALGTLTVFGAAAAPDDAAPARGQMLVRMLTRDLGEVEYAEVGRVQVEATYATAEYVTFALGGASAAAALEPDRHVAFLLTERTHVSNLPRAPVQPALYVDGQAVSAVDAKVVTDSVHHRATVFRFERDGSFGQGHHVVTLRLPSGPEATWHLPIVMPAAASVAGGPLGFGEQWGLILALLGGMIAAMWPCLFQLTVYFIPALAGVAMQQAGGGSDRARRRQVLSAAFYFLVGLRVV